MREIKFRGKSKRSRRWFYGSLIVQKHKMKVTSLDGDLYEYKYSIQYLNKNNNWSTIEVLPETVGQFVGSGEYGDIYEGMDLYDEYAEENCTIEYDEEDCGFRLCYSDYTERIEGLSGLHILNDNPELLEKGQD